MRIRKNDLINDEALIVTTEYCLGGGRAWSQYYALVGETAAQSVLENNR